MEVAGWLTLLLAAIRSQTLAEESARRHPTLPGSLSFGGFWSTELHSWAGATVVVALIVLAKAASRPLTTFLAVYMTYRFLDLLWLIVFLVLSLGEAKTRLETFLRPIRLIRQLKQDRHLPSSEEDVAALRQSGEAIDEMWDRVFWFYVWVALVNMAVSAALILLTLQWDSGGRFVAALWLVNVLATHVIEQRYLPQFYGL